MSRREVSGNERSAPKAELAPNKEQMIRTVRLFVPTEIRGITTNIVVGRVEEIDGLVLVFPNNAEKGHYSFRKEDVARIE